MPQSTITAWLGKGANIQKQHKPSTAAEDVPTPDPSDVSTAAKSTDGASFNVQELAGPPNVEVRPVTKENLQQFRRLIGLLLPVSYGDLFYSSIVNDQTISKLSLVAYWRDSPKKHPRMVAGISGKIITEPQDSRLGTYDKTRPALYIATLGTLSPYREHGLAELLLRHVHQLAVNEFQTACVTVHVWEANDEARLWYTKRGFEEVGSEKNYYRRLQPGNAWLLQRVTRPSDLLGHSMRVKEDS